MVDKNNPMVMDFLSRVELIDREGVSELVAWLEHTDFFSAPASSRFHGAYPGGLLEHSINVHNRLGELNAKLWLNLDDESVGIVALFHDLCKVNNYTQDWKNQKTYDPTKVARAHCSQVKTDDGGKFIWERVPYYKRDEKFPFGGHGSKSLYLVMNFIKLTPEEASAINCHMGPWDKQDYGDPGAVFGSNPLAWALHVADEMATYFDEKEESENA